jgi:eukaryotic-like serine/threonine-protein kinase
MNTPKMIGRYEILEELGHGAMGTVYRAKDPAMERVVALKTISAAALDSQQGTEFRERFFREARAAGRLAHPGIVPVFDVGEHDGMPFLVMELINGQTLADKIKKGERLLLERVYELGQQIAEALGYAHQHGVVHRDIKPANILLTSRETYGIERPKITDFGVAKLTAGQITMTGQMLGTPAFMPPEQFTGAPIDGRADLFSLGVILYWLATGEQAFPGETVTSVSYKVVHTEPAPPRKLNPSIPAKLDSVILKCLAKNPEERYQTGEDLARDLSGLRTGTQTTLRQIQVSSAVMHDNVDATLDWKPIQPQAATAIPSEQHSSGSTTEGKKKTYGFALVAVIAAMIAAGGWYALRSKQEAAPEAAASAGPAATAVPASSTISQPAPPASAATPARVETAVPSPAAVPSAAPGNSGVITAARTSTGLVPATAHSSKTAALGKVDFDPANLPANENAKLKIETTRVPPDLEFTVEMNGKVYLRWNTSSSNADNKNLFVPPGVQEFRVTAESGSVRKTSNIVSTEFKAKKKKTLKIEFRDQVKTRKSQGPAELSENSQIFATLK